MKGNLLAKLPRVRHLPVIGESGGGPRDLLQLNWYLKNVGEMFEKRKDNKEVIMIMVLRMKKCSVAVVKVQS